MHRASDASKPGNGSSSSSSRSSHAAAASPAPHQHDALDAGVDDGHVCPFCGLVREVAEDFDATAPCPRCTLADTPTTRNATKARIGPWHVRQMRNPWAPGMRWETLLALIKRGQVTKDSVVRGPTTHQLWRRASEIKGLSREFGLCYSCGGAIDAEANLCGHCNRLQEPPVNPNVLVESRDFGQPPQNGAQSQQQPPAGGVRSNGNGPSRRHGGAFDGPANLDVGSAAATVRDYDDMLTVDDPDAAEADHAAASRAPSRANPSTAGKPTKTNPARGAAAPAPAPSARRASEPPPEPEPPARPVPLRPRQPGSEDALLTPQELAAAFRLDFAPPPGQAPAGRAAAGHPAPRPPRRKRSKASKLFVALLLLGGGAGALLYVRPDVREQAVDWSETKYASVKSFIASRTSPPAPVVPTNQSNTPAAPPMTRPSGGGGGPVLARSPAPQPGGATLTTPPPTRPAQRPQPVVVTPSSPPETPAAPAPKSSGGPKTVVVADSPLPAPVAPSRETVKALEPSDVPAGDLPVTAAARTTNPVAAPTPPVEIIKIAPPAPAPATATASATAANKAPAPSPSPAAKASPATTPQKVWTNISEAEDEARRLWRLAFDAEQNQDYVEAVSLYEQIKKLPPEVHQSGLDMRLSLAKKLVK